VTTLLAVLALAAASARVEAVGLTAVGTLPAVRLTLSGTPGLVTVAREGDLARVSIGNAELGVRFAGSRRFTWTPVASLDAGWLAASPTRLDRLEITAGGGGVTVTLRLPADASVRAQRDRLGILLLFERAGPAAEDRAAPAAAVNPGPPGGAPVEARVAAAPVEQTPPVVGPPEADPTKTPRPVPAPAAQEVSPAPAAPASADTADLARGLFPATKPSEADAVVELYARLFPAAPPAPAAPEPAASEPIAPGEASGVPVGPFRVHAAVDARYVDADTYLDSASQPTRDRFFALAPSVVAEAPVAAGRFSLDYRPVLRAFASYDQLNSSSHLGVATLELPIGRLTSVRLGDHFVAGTLDTRAVDPGGEYFFGLGRFYRNDADAAASITVGPRLSIELAGATGRLRFREPSSFFDYDTRSASAGLGFELTPGLKAVASYAYETVPRPEARPQAEARAHAGRLTLSGEILPRLTGELGVGYRNQANPNAGPGGQRYSGLTLAGSLSRQLSPDASATLLVSRSTPSSAFESNGFYVATSLQATTQLPLPLELRLLGGIGYGWNDYRVVSPAIGHPRADRILGWFVGLRRPLRRRLALSGSYRAEDRRSNVGTFDTNSNGLVLQLEWDALGSRPR